MGQESARDWGRTSAAADADPGSDAKVSLIGTLVAGKYRVDSSIGSGSTGEVYLCRHIGLDKIVALKVLHRDMVKHANFVERFKREARAASRLEHPNSVRVLDFGEDPGGVLYIAMEYIAGRDLWSVLDEEWPLDNARIVDIMAQVLGALGTAHTLGIVHRDLKPENIMVRREMRDDGDKDLVTVCDFGIAQLSPMQLAGSFSPLTPVVTGDGMVVGTPAYMSPEQARAEPLDARSDIYSAGVVLFQMLTRQLPFTAETPLAVAVLHCSEPPPSPSQLALVHPRLESVCLRALSKVKQQRYQTAREMQVALQAALDATVVPHPSLRKKRRQYLPLSEPAVPQPPLPKPPASLAPVETERPSHAPAVRDARAKRSATWRAVAVAAFLAGTGISIMRMDFSSGPSTQRPRPSLTATATPPQSESASAPATDPMAGGLPSASGEAHAPLAAPQPPPEAVAVEPSTPSVPETHLSATEPPDPPTSETRGEHDAHDVASTRPAAGKTRGTGAASLSSTKSRGRQPNERAAGKPDDKSKAPARAAASDVAEEPKVEEVAAPAPPPPPPSRNEAELASLQEPYQATDDQPAHAAVMQMGVLSAPAPRNPTAAAPPPPTSTTSSGPASAQDLARASVTVADITSQSAVSKASIRSALNQSSLTRCYRDALRSGTAQPGGGTASLELSTNMSGRIATATVQASHLPKALQQCFEQVARAGRVKEVDTGIARATVMLKLRP
jgi:eukaryotic-like serine/threonine-protein kinase